MLNKLLHDFAQAKVLVVGDAMLDRYWYGGVERISPEAPVPVVAIRGSDERPGGAANVARNVNALGADCLLLSITGKDQEADTIERLLKQSGIHCRLYRDPLINTIVKLRVISRNQQLIRLDFEAPASKDARVGLLDFYLEHVKDFQAVIVSDYGKGGLGYVQEMIAAGREAGIPVIVDPKGDDYNIYRRATLITPNRKEFEQVAGRARDTADLERRATGLVAGLEIEGVLITRGEEGMSLIERTGRILHMPARVREVFDVTGAGDSVIATIACAFAVGGAIEEGLRLANVAAGIVVGKLGAATASPEEILNELAMPDARPHTR